MIMSYKASNQTQSKSSLFSFCNSDFLVNLQLQEKSRKLWDLNFWLKTFTATISQF